MNAIHTVRIIAGIDDRYYPPALGLVRSLAFRSAHVHLVHVIESLLPDKSFPKLKADHPLSVMMLERERIGNLELAKARAMLDDTGYGVEAELVQGNPAQVLIESAAALPADVIAIGSAQKSAWASLFFGSVTKAITAGAAQSILVAKNERITAKGLRVVLATDHSSYCTEAIKQFVGWGSIGISRVTVVTAAQTSQELPESSVKPKDAPPGRMTSRSQIQAASAAVCEQLAMTGFDADYEIAESHPNEAIARLMNDSGADLLVVGARGHGFWDRMRLGSISHFQVVGTPHNVLVIRNPAPGDTRKS